MVDRDHERNPRNDFVLMNGLNQENKIRFMLLDHRKTVVLYLNMRQKNIRFVHREKTSCKKPFIGDCRVSKKTRSSSVKNGD